MNTEKLEFEFAFSTDLSYPVHVNEHFERQLGKAVMKYAKRKDYEAPDCTGVDRKKLDTSRITIAHVSLEVVVDDQ